MIETSDLAIQLEPTSVAAFIGTFQSGPFYEATLLTATTISEYTFGSEGETLDAIHQFFENGGQSCWAVRLNDEGDYSLKAITAALESLAEVDLNLLCIPVLVQMDPATAAEIILEAEAYCERRRAFFIVDAPHVLKEPTDVLAWLQANPEMRHESAALYYPRVMIDADSRCAQTRPVAASGTAAGVIARFDQSHNVWTAPAGAKATLNKVLALERSLTNEETELLTDHGVNCLRDFPGPGKVVWGARTLSEDPHWRYVPIRRLVLSIHLSIEHVLSSWVIFEPNTAMLWERVRRSVHSLLATVWLQGGFKGTTLKDAFFVKTGRTEMTQEDIDQGRLNVVIGIAPVKPAEFVIIRIGLWTVEHDP